MAAGSSGVFGVAAFEPEARFFEALFVKIMEELRVSGFGELAAQGVDAFEEREKIWFGGRGAHGLHRLFQFFKGGENLPLGFVHSNDVSRLRDQVNAAFYEAFVGTGENDAESEMCDEGREFARVGSTAANERKCSEINQIQNSTERGPDKPSVAVVKAMNERHHDKAVDNGAKKMHGSGEAGSAKVHGSGRFNLAAHDGGRNQAGWSPWNAACDQPKE
jgi:hypothetical protein